MNADALYLKTNVQIEPLVDQWYAWSQLIPPATAARNLTERHIPIMESYIGAPEAHAAAVRDPSMLGGPFIDYGGQRVDEIRALCNATKTKRRLLELSAALIALDRMLAAEASGHSLERLYAKVPPALQGYAELVYDLNNHPSYQLREALLYRSDFYDPSMQSLLLSITTGDDRPFVMSTPRLESPGLLHWRVPFRCGRVDDLFRAKASPQPAGAIRELFGADAVDGMWETFFTPEAPPPYVPYAGRTARWRYFGHACILVETPRSSILCDPVLSYTYESTISRYSYLDLPDTIDYVLITHNHIDHILFETMLQLRHKIRHIVVPAGGGSLQDPSLRLLFEQIGFRNVIEIGEMDEIEFADGVIIGLPFIGEHGDLDVRTKSSYLVRLGKHSLMLAADSCNVDPKVYDHVHRCVGDIEALFLGMECEGAPVSWYYGPLYSRRLGQSMDHSRRLSGSDYRQGMQMVDTLGCREVYVYAMGQEPWLNYVMSKKYTEQSKPIVESNRLIEECRRGGLCAERLFGEREMFLT